MTSSCRIDKEGTVKILYILRSAPDASTKKIMEVQSAGNQTMTIDLMKGAVSYHKLVVDILSHDKVFCF